MSQTLLETTQDDLRAEKLNSAGNAWGERISANVANASLTFKTNGTAQGSVATTITSGKHTFLVDEPVGLAGDDQAASPVEYALGALISCQVVVYRLYAHQLGIKIESLTIDAEGDLDVRGLFGIDENTRSGFSDVRLKVKITGPESAERYAELQQTVDAHCPVFDIVANPTPISVELVVSH